MKNDIILAGVGGQGILTIAAIIGKAAMKAGLNVKQSEVHGMAQRGGAVLAHLRLSDKPIYSDLIAEHSADVILAVEPMEALRHITGLADSGAIIVNSTPIKNIADYPETDAVIAEIKKHPKSVVVDADRIAVESGSARAMNIVMLGAYIGYTQFIDENLVLDCILRLLGKKPEFIELNKKAFAMGLAAGKKARG